MASTSVAAHSRQSDRVAVDDAMFAKCEESRIAFWVSRVFCVGVVIESAHSSAQSDGFSSSRAEFPAVRFADRCIALAGGEDLFLLPESPSDRLGGRSCRAENADRSAAIAGGGGKGAAQVRPQGRCDVADRSETVRSGPPGCPPRGRGETTGNSAATGVQRRRREDGKL